eukprot:9060627-Pyramimonas_sp.AAC.1
MFVPMVVPMGVFMVIPMVALMVSQLSCVGFSFRIQQCGRDLLLPLCSCLLPAFCFLPRRPVWGLAGAVNV